MENVGSKLVQRGTSGGIKVGDIYTTTPLNNGAIASNSGIAYKDSDGIIKYTNNFTEFRKLTNTISRDDMNTVEKLDVNGSFEMWGGSRTITLNENAKKYKVIVVKAGGSKYDVHFLLLIPNQYIRTREHDRNGGGEIELIWNGATTITATHYTHRDGKIGEVAGVWGII